MLFISCRVFYRICYLDLAFIWLRRALGRLLCRTIRKWCYYLLRSVFRSRYYRLLRSIACGRCYYLLCRSASSLRYRLFESLVFRVDGFANPSGTDPAGLFRFGSRLPNVFPGSRLMID
jgi:hypothetical protein